MVMIMVNIYEVKAKLSEYVEAALRGERVMICKRNRPVVELRAIDVKRVDPRPIGGGPYAFDVPPSFFEPLPDQELDVWDEGPIYPETRAKRSRVAEKPDRRYGRSSTRKTRR